MSETNHNNTSSDKQLQHLASLLKNMRLNENLTQDEVAIALNIHRNTIARIENGKPFSVSFLFQFASFYDIDLSDLFKDID